MASLSIYGVSVAVWYKKEHSQTLKCQRAYDSLTKDTEYRRDIGRLLALHKQVEAIWKEARDGND